MDEIKRELNILQYDPNALGYGAGVLFAPAITIFKMFVSSRVNILYHRSMAPDPASDEVQKPLKSFLDSDEAKPAATLLDLRSIALVVGFLASLGITFAWNAGAIGPFVLALGVMYLCYNFGFLFFMIRGQVWENIVVLLLTLFVIAAVGAPFFASSFRLT